MNLLNLFKKSDWTKLKSHSVGVQEDISCLIAFDFLIKSSLSNNTRRFLDSFTRHDEDEFRLLHESLAKKELIAELLLAVLSTGVGKVFNEIKWNKVVPDTTVKLLGILSMCEFRNNEQLTTDNDIKKSGYSFVSNEARSQFLVLLANDAGIKNLESLKQFDSKFFSSYWLETRNFIFNQLQHNICAETKGFTSVVRERFDKLSKARKETLLILADSLERNKSVSEQKVEAANINVEPQKPSAPFNAELHKLEHPYLYVPHTKISKLMNDCTLEILDEFNEMTVNTYEFRRLSGLKDDVPDLMLNMILMFDATVLSYCTLVSVIQSQEPQFVGSGVWKVLTEKFKLINITQFAFMAGFKKNGMVSPEALNPTLPKDGVSSGLDLFILIRKSPNNFLKNSGEDSEKLRVLLQGTIAFGNMLNHPTYSKTLTALIESKFKKIKNVTEQFSKEELLSWDQQKDLK